MILLSNKEDKCHDRQEHLFDIIIAKTPRERHVGDTIVIGKNHVHWDMSFMIPFTIDKIHGTFIQQAFKCKKPIDKLRIVSFVICIKY